MSRDAATEQLTTSRHNHANGEQEELHTPVAATFAAQRLHAPPAGQWRPSSRDVLGMQASVGNRAVGRMLASRTPAPPAPTTPDPKPATAKDALLQRRVFLGSAREELDSIGWWKRRQGKGPHRNVGQMVSNDDVNYYFQSEAEMLAYANGKTETMGYLEPERTWIRLTDGAMTVLGELHGATTLMDVVRATGTSKYRYEPFNDIPKELLARSKRMRNAKAKGEKKFKDRGGDTSGADRDHSGDELLPKVVVGLLGLRDTVAAAVRASAAPPAAGAAGGGGRDQGYTRAEAEMRMLNLAMLTAAKSAKYNLPAEDLWVANQAVFNETAKEFLRGQPLERTSFIQAIAAGTFTFEAFIDSFKTAARKALRAAGMAFEFGQFETQSEAWQAADAADAPEWERMREFYMMEKIRAAAGAGDLLFGMGDIHRLHLEEILIREGFHVRKLSHHSRAQSSFPTFVDEQRRAYPQ